MLIVFVSVATVVEWNYSHVADTVTFVLFTSTDIIDSAAELGPAVFLWSLWKGLVLQRP